MTPEKWLKIKWIVQSAMEKPEGERHQFASQECGDDDALLFEVNALIASHAEAEELWKRSGAIPTSKIPVGRSNELQGSTA